MALTNAPSWRAEDRKRTLTSRSVRRQPSSPQGFRAGDELVVRLWIDEAHELDES
jgi:hypothetical protein